MLKSVVEDPAFRDELKDLTAVYVESVLGSEAMREKLADLARQKVEEYAGRGLGGFALRAYRSFNEADFQRRIDQAVAEIPGALDPLLDRLDEALDRVPALVEARSGQLEAFATKTVLGFVERLDVYSMIVENARGFDEAQLENLLKKTSNEQLNYIKYLGGVLGVVGGVRDLGAGPRARRPHGVQPRAVGAGRGALPARPALGVRRAQPVEGPAERVVADVAVGEV